ncbi:MAG: helix-turn-helix transcriptional regulator [Methanoregula sp.]|jgi:putative transcriptional regulator|uniref:helix-turn-helix transcriptional regulator n=1 Tax=Methanoregula sp. TaxID=2052170 RepID=UPI0025D525B2|nr:helix-turn-helix transcriptional regulator [Methanoregula sp.]MCK9632639.1 helix-turn-helix transcriptional regulator [Methanoregula sp.]
MKNKIKVYRAMRNMTQEELAGQLRVTRRTINSIERDKYNPSIEVAFRIARLFNVPVEEMFSLDEDE